jgi:hypothetical protein
MWYRVARTHVFCHTGAVLRPPHDARCLTCERVTVARKRPWRFLRYQLLLWLPIVEFASTAHQSASDVLRAGAILLVLSIIDGAIQAAVASQQSGGGVYISPSGAPSVMTELLRERASIPPRVVKAQGDRIAILVARDLDFRAAHRSPADGSSSGDD